MRIHSLILAAVIAVSPVAALALNPQPEPPGVQAHQLNPQPEPPGATDSATHPKNGAVHVQQHSHVARTVRPMHDATLTQGSDSSEKHHGQGTNNPNHATWAAGSDSGSDGHHTNNNLTEKPTWSAGSDSSEKYHGLGQLHASTTVHVNQ